MIDENSTQPNDGEQQHHDGDAAALERALLSRRQLLALGGASASAFLLAACSGSSSDGGGASSSGTSAAPGGTTAASGSSASSGSGGSPATVRFWHWYTDQENQLPKVIEDFEAANPNIKIDMRIIADVEGGYLPALLSAAAADDMPEIFAPHVHSIRFGKEGLAANLKAELGDSFMSDFFPSANSMFIDADAQYAVGWMAQTMGFYYDPDILAAAGVDGEPETWDDMIEASNKIKQSTGGLGMMQAADNGFSVNDLWFPMITGFSGDPDTVRQLDQHDGATWTDKPVVDALTLYQRTIDEGLWQDNMTGMDQVACLNALYAGAGAGFYSGSWNPGRIYADAPPDLVKRLKVMKTPMVASGGRNWTGNSAGAAFGVSNHSPAKDAALTFMQYLYSAEVYSWVMSESVSLPATASAAETVTDPIIKTMASWLPDGCRHWLTGPAGQVVADNVMLLTSGELDAAGAAQAMEDGAKDLDYS